MHKTRYTTVNKDRDLGIHSTQGIFVPGTRGEGVQRDIRVVLWKLDTRTVRNQLAYSLTDRLTRLGT